MDKKVRWDISCPSCGRKFLKKDLEERGYVDKTKIGDCITCEKCEFQWIEK